MTPQQILRKTAMGQAALQSRGQVGPRERLALILINGRDTLAALAPKIGADTLALADALLKMGLVELAPQEPARPKAPASPPAPAAVKPAAAPAWAPKVHVIPAAPTPAAATLPAAAPAPAPPAADQAARLLPLKREAYMRLAPQFGPDVDVVCSALLSAGTSQDFIAALLGIESKLAIYLGRKEAHRLLQDLRP